MQMRLLGRVQTQRSYKRILIHWRHVCKCKTRGIQSTVSYDMTCGEGETQGSNGGHVQKVALQKKCRYTLKTTLLHVLRYQLLLSASSAAIGCCDLEEYSDMPMQWCNCILPEIFHNGVLSVGTPSKTTLLHILRYKLLLSASLVAIWCCDLGEHTAMRMQYCNCILPMIFHNGVLSVGTPSKPFCCRTCATSWCSVQAC